MARQRPHPAAWPPHRSHHHVSESARNALAQIRDQGYAIDDREHQPHTRAVAAAILANGPAVAALVASTSSQQQPHLRTLLDATTTAAATLTHVLNATESDGSLNPEGQP
jgi:DNA-binding IclR family transcriptional regulator